MGYSIGRVVHAAADCVGSWLGGDCLSGISEVPIDTNYDYTITTSDGTAVPGQYSSGTITIQPQVAASAIAFPYWIGSDTKLEPEKKKCNYCGTETADYRELRIGRMTTVVICDMCQLKALSKVLEPKEDSDGGDDGCDGDCECGCSEKDCRPGLQEEKEKEG